MKANFIKPDSSELVGEVCVICIES